MQDGLNKTEQTQKETNQQCMSYDSLSSLAIIL